MALGPSSSRRFIICIAWDLSARDRTVSPWPLALAMYKDAIANVASNASKDRRPNRWNNILLGLSSASGPIWYIMNGSVVTSVPLVMIQYQHPPTGRANPKALKQSATRSLTIMYQRLVRAR